VGFVRLGEIGDTTQGTTGLVAVFHSTYFFSLRGVPGEEHDLPLGCIVSLATVECLFGGEKRLEYFRFNTRAQNIIIG
jgi:hypothetical protein